MFKNNNDRQRAYQKNPRTPKKHFVKQGTRAMTRYNSTKAFRRKKTK